MLLMLNVAILMAGVSGCDGGKAGTDLWFRLAHLLRHNLIRRGAFRDRQYYVRMTGIR